MFVRYKETLALESLKNKNVAIAAFVAAEGRLMLGLEMLKLGDRVIYHDTDSILYNRY